MTLRTAKIVPPSYHVETKDVEIKTKSRVLKREKIKIFYTPDWEKMKDYPQEALDFFKYRAFKLGDIECIDLWATYYVPAEVAQDKFFTENHITKDNLVKLENCSCSRDGSVIVTWDDGK